MKLVYFQTFGCQMNVADSESLMQVLSMRSFAPADSPDEADLIIVNTCSVRENAEEKAKARIIEYVAKKRGRRGAKLWVVGCMAERLGDALKTEIRGIDAVIGSKELEDPVAVVNRYYPWGDEVSERATASGTSEFIPVMRGCNNFCAYCIVPYVRGREHSIAAAEIETRIRGRLDAGIKEITLLGQNVNSYHDGETDFPKLLSRIASLDGIERLRFTTSHPKDCSVELLETMAAHPKIARHLHLPVQAGSNRTLERMNRNYTVEHYHTLIKRARELMPDLDITTDLLVGFPGETDEDFEATMRLVEEVRYTSAFMFAYSVRSGTAAAQMEDLPHDIKLARLTRLIKLQTAITREHFDAMVGKTVHALVANTFTKNDTLFNRAQDNGFKRVLIPGAIIVPGTIVHATIEKSTGMTLVGKVVHT